MDRIRVVTVNIWNRLGPWEERLPLLRRGLSDLAPDVVGLQEVIELRPEGEAEPDDLGRHVAEGTGLSALYGAAHTLAPGLTMGNAILSRHPVVEHRTLPLPGLHETGEARSLLYALVRTPAGDLPVFITHLSWKLHEGWVRMAQVERIAQHIATIAPIRGSTLPPVLMGDLNAEPDSDEIRFLRGLHTRDGRSVFLADCWQWGGGGGPGYTFDPKNPYAAQAMEPPRRIDYVFVRGPDSRGRGRPLSARLCLDRPEQDVWPTDHFGVVVDLAC